MTAQLDSPGNSSRNRTTKLKNQINAEGIETAPENIVQPNAENNISGFAKLSLHTESTDLSDIEAEINRIESSEPQNEWKIKLQIAILSAVIVVSAILTTIFQSMLLSANHYQFPFPIFSAAVTVIVQLVCCAAVILYYKKFGLLCREIWSLDGLKATYQAILPTSIVTGAELGISLISLQMVSVSFFTMVKSSAIMFILIGAFMTGQERINFFLVSVILLTGIGVTCAAWDPKSTAGVEIVGFSLVLLSSILNAAKWILTELLLNEHEAYKRILDKINAPSKKGEKPSNLTPILSVLLIAPLTFLALIACAAIFEGFPFQIISFFDFESTGYAVVTLGSLLMTSLLVFIIRITDFRLIQLVSIVTFSLLGVVKQIFMIVLSVLFLGDILFPINLVGLILTIVGVGLYNYYRVQEAQEKESIKRGSLEIEMQTTQRMSKSRIIPNVRVK